MTRTVGDLTVFAVEATSLQVVWRNLGAGTLRLATRGIEPVDLTIEPGAGSGGTIVSGLAPDSDITIDATGTALDGAVRLRTRTLADLPGEELSRIATISDLHLGTEAFGHRHTIVETPSPVTPHPLRCSTAAVNQAVEWGAGTIAVKGDITNNGQIGQWRSYADLVRSRAVPVIALPGNHDRAFRPGLGISPEDASALFGFVLASPMLVQDHPGVRLILVDTTSGNHHRGSIEGVASQLCDAVAETPPDAMALVLTHHQLHQYPVREGWPEGISRRQAVTLLDELARTGRRVLVSSGHTHRHRRWEHRGIVNTQVGSTKDYPGVWAGYSIHEGGLRQTVQRVTRPDCIRWTDHTRRAAAGLWRWISPGFLHSRCFNHTWGS